MEQVQVRLDENGRFQTVTAPNWAELENADDAHYDLVFLGAAGSTRKGSKATDSGLRTLERNSGRTKDFTRQVPKPLVVQIFINDKPVRALLDSGSLADFMSTTLVDQLKLTTDVLAQPLTVQLAASGSKTKVDHCVTARLRYQAIDCDRCFEVMNSEYDVILGTPWIFQHRVVLGLNPSLVEIGSAEPQPLKGPQVTTLASLVARIADTEIEQLRLDLKRYAKDICKTAAETPLPPLRAINHTIPLIDEGKVYPWRPSKCPDAFKSEWRAKRDVYVKAKRWEVHSGVNAMPMLMIPK
ncbi:hypothetical protein PENSPDRAFT_595203, partial [Peniophora sp. CONT]